MSDVIEYKGYTIFIRPDEDPLDPRDADNLTLIRGWHRRFDIGDGPTIRTEDYPDFDAMLQALITEHGPLAMLAPLYWYEHSGVTCKMGVPMTFGDHATFASDLRQFRSTVMDDAGWDSGVAGVVMVTVARIAELGAPSEDVVRQAEAEVEEYARYLRGEYVGYVIEKKHRCGHVDEDGDQCDTVCTHVEDSCWGFDDDKYALEQAKGVIDYRIAQKEGARP